MDVMIYFFLYLAFVTWVSYLPVLKTRQYEPPYFWRWSLLLTFSGPLLAILTYLGFFFAAPEGPGHESFMMTGVFILLLITPFQLLVPMTAYLFICATLKERRQGSA
jgi:hypothetical protein